MLVLSRKCQQSVVVGGSAGFERMLKVTVLEIDGSKVRLGFEVDKDVPVHRWEVWEKIQAARTDCLKGGPGPPVGAGGQQQSSAIIHRMEDIGG